MSTGVAKFHNGAFSVIQLSLRSSLCLVKLQCYKKHVTHSRGVSCILVKGIPTEQHGTLAQNHDARAGDSGLQVVVVTITGFGKGYSHQRSVYPEFSSSIWAASNLKFESDLPRPRDSSSGTRYPTALCNYGADAYHNPLAAAKCLFVADLLNSIGYQLDGMPLTGNMLKLPDALGLSSLVFLPPRGTV
ncbi:hypothetical protein BDZ91DRAFT_821686 [Kalaharituber pfeilii]|nr:hypothetical protein BDZ91DRAFT_821686 [Kalaharituber pfeilii]